MGLRWILFDCTWSSVCDKARERRVENSEEGFISDGKRSIDEEELGDKKKRSKGYSMPLLKKKKTTGAQDYTVGRACQATDAATSMQFVHFREALLKFSFLTPTLTPPPGTPDSHASKFRYA
jgi:hypothetical protein